ncbi:MAG: hypothetical protein KGZ25_05985, partial [Planctomycetes bacterium]|nr:hypothetical protein [Planctomycetota bacterium]
GAAIVAAVGSSGSFADAAGNMVHSEREVSPRDQLVKTYEEKYQRFVEVCRNKGYLDGNF